MHKSSRLCPTNIPHYSITLVCTTYSIKPFLARSFHPTPASTNSSRTSTGEPYPTASILTTHHKYVDIQRFTFEAFVQVSSFSELINLFSYYFPCIVPESTCDYGISFLAQERSQLRITTPAQKGSVNH